MIQFKDEEQLNKQPLSMRKDLSTIYNIVFQWSNHLEDLEKFLQWLAFSKCDTTVAEIDKVRTVDLRGVDGPFYDVRKQSREPGTVLSVGNGLVTEINGTVSCQLIDHNIFDKWAGMVKLAHYSVKEYLIKHLRSAPVRSVENLDIQYTHHISRAQYIYLPD